MTRIGVLHAHMFVLVSDLRGSVRPSSATKEETESRDRRRGSRFRRSQAPFLG